MQGLMCILAKMAAMMAIVMVATGSAAVAATPAQTLAKLSSYIKRN